MMVHRGTDPEAIKVAERFGLTFDGMMEDLYQLTVVKGPEKAKGITFYVKDLSQVEARLHEKFKEFGIEEGNPIGSETTMYRSVAELPEFRGKAWRAESGYSHARGTTVAAIIRFEREDLGNEYPDISDELLKDLDRYSAEDAVWVNRRRKDCLTYLSEGESEEVIGTVHLPEDTKIVTLDYCGGYLVLIGTATPTLKKGGNPRKPSWVTAQVCPKCGAKPSLGEGFERVFESAGQSIYGRDVEQVQCENCNTYFGIIDARTLEILDVGAANPMNNDYLDLRTRVGNPMITDVDTCLKDIADFYIDTRRGITEPQLESILMKHCGSEAEVQKFVRFLETEPGQLRFKTLLRERKGG